MNAARPLSVVLLAWNRWDLTRRALDTLLATDCTGAQIIVVDNGSTDGTAEGLRDYHDRVRVLTLPRNLGFVRGNNAGIDLAGPTHDIVLLNNDLELRQHDWLLRLRECAYAAADIGIAGCRLVDGEGRLLHAGTVVMPDDGIGVQLASGRVERDVGQYTAPSRDVQGVVFAAVLIRREVIAAIGPLHTDYDTYVEDTDYCLRARAAGFRTVLCGSVSLVHRQHGSTADNAAHRQDLLATGRATFLRHWGGELASRYGRRVMLFGALDFPRATAEWLRPLVRAMDQAGIDVRYRPLHAPVLPAAIAETPDSQDHVLNTIRRRVPLSNVPLLAAGDPALWLTLPTAGFRIGILPDDPFALDACQRAGMQAMDMLWVTREWLVERVRKTGFKGNIHIVPWGVDPDYAHPGIGATHNPHGEFVVAATLRWNEADAPWRLMQVFARAFRREDPVRLVLWVDAPGIDLAAATRAVALNPHGGRVTVLPRPLLPEEQRNGLLAAADAYLALTATPGQGYAALRALAMGKPVIVPATALPCDGVDIPRAFRLPSEPAAAVDLAAVDALRRLVRDVKERQAWPDRCGATLRQERRWLDTAQLMRQLLEQLDGQARPAPRERPPARAQGLVVLGMHRSGTSCVSGLLQLMGAYGGSAAGFLSNPAENARGFLERGDVHAACVEALRLRGGDWSIPLGWDAEALPASRARLRAALRTPLDDLSAAGLWFLKEPRLCLLMPELDDLAADAVFVHVVRAPAAVAASIARRDGLTIPHALALWEHYNLQAFAATKARRRVLVDYHALLDDPLRVTAALHTRLLELGVRGLRRPCAEEIHAWVGAPLASQRHARLPHVSAAQSEFWALLESGRVLLDAPLPALSASSEALLLQLAGEHRQALRREREDRRDG
ncbi:glycosyltransferase [Tahibacter amnicola]|uniref:Glycosyltransferase n=1 Tax=Tahibacter amnicola TaxID=2976241 RepID=A0ABY6BEI6_9GAMM|nr:glycosyltransferase [Tahibacter amnicola]UXI67957.1 glycosyltransferase [Tahibacter amnicola]